MPRSASAAGLARRGVIPRKQFYTELFVFNTVILILGLISVLVKVRPVAGFRLPDASRRSEALRDGLRVGLIGGLGAGLIYALSALIAGLGGGLRVGLGRGLGVGLICCLKAGLGAALFAGGAFALRHLVLRLFLWKSGTAPLRYITFLDRARALLFLRQVGGGYVFTHQLLREYFVSLRGGRRRRPALVYRLTNQMCGWLCG
jgi:hypothetical protein